MLKNWLVSKRVSIVVGAVLAVIILVPVLTIRSNAPADVVLFFSLLPFVALAYLFPSIVAIMRRHRNATGVCLLNLFLGWSLMGWIAALIWSVYRPNETPG